MNDNHSLFADHTATVPRGFTSSPASGPAGSSSLASGPRGSSSTASGPRSSSSPSSGHQGPSSSPLGAGGVSLPHHRLIAYGVALELLAAVRAAQVRDPKLRDQATRAAKSAFLNLCEGLPDDRPGVRRRYFRQADGSVHEVAGALDLAAAIGALDEEVARQGIALAARVRALLRGLLR